MAEKLESVGPIIEGVLARLISRYEELSEACYRVSVTRHGERGRFRRGHHARRLHPALLKKVDLDRDLARLYCKFFGGVDAGPSQADTLSRSDDQPISTSISNSRPHGRVIRVKTSSPDSVSTWEV